MGRIDLKVVTKPSDERHWYALRVKPQAEYVVSYLLLKAGVEAFVPTETRYRRRTRYVAQKAEFAYPILIIGVAAYLIGCWTMIESTKAMRESTKMLDDANGILDDANGILDQAMALIDADEANAPEAS